MRPPGDNWLSQLAPAHAPPAPGWWPPAPGWWGVALLVALAAGLAVWLWQAWRGAFPRRVALAELRQIEASGADRITLAQSLESLLRRYALTVLPREQVARLSGEAWLALLASEGAAPLSGAAGRSLLTAAYGGSGNDDREQWLAGTEAFVRRAARRPLPGVPAVVNRLGRLCGWGAR